jgi:LruC domain-containing protein
MLPESTVVNPAYIASDIRTDIRFDDDAAFATASITFLNEGAGYRNSLGYFVYQTDNPPATKEDIPAHTIIFPNASKPNDGNLQQGDTVELGIQLVSGQSLGFFVVPNGWSYSGSGSTIVNDGPWNTPFYSTHLLNPEPAASQRHNVVFLDAPNELLIVGFDDQFITSGDQDYNDVLFAVNISPFHAVDGVNTDGSIDSGYIPLEQDNGDTDTTTSSYYPSQNGFATLAYEDRWPVLDDYDFNDLVVKYRLKRYLASQSGLKRLEGTFNIQAKGAAYHNGFALRLPGVAQSNIESISITKDGQAVSHAMVETGASDVVLVISPDISVDLAPNCGVETFYRTIPGVNACNQSANMVFELDVVLINPVSPDVVGQPPYDPFLFGINDTFHGEIFPTQPGRQWEVHLKQFAGTNLFNNAFFNMGDDTSNNGSNNFISSNNMPWVLNLADEWDHVQEHVDMNHAYPDFAKWVAADGFNFTDWYLRSKADTSKLYE